MAIKYVSIIGVDLAKQGFQLLGATAAAEVMFCKTLLRNQFLAFSKRHLGFQLPCRPARQLIIGRGAWRRSVTRCACSPKVRKAVFEEPEGRHGGRRGHRGCSRLCVPLRRRCPMNRASVRGSLCVSIIFLYQMDDLSRQIVEPDARIEAASKHSRFAARLQ